MHIKVMKFIRQDKSNNTSLITLFLAQVYKLNKNNKVQKPTQA